MRALTRLMAFAVLTTILPVANAWAQAGVSYQIPPDNPFVDRVGADEIYAYGLRNPFRFSFDRETGDLLIGDVGDGTREEISWIGARAASGANFGWACREGKQPGPKAATPECPVADPVEPLFDYSQTGPRAVTGGVVVRDPALTGLFGRYLYVDFYRGDVRSLRLDLADPADSPTDLTRTSISSFGEDALGRIYITDLQGNAVLRLLPGGTAGTLSEEPLVGSFAAPVAVAGVPGKGNLTHLLVAEKGGIVRLVLNGFASATPFLDVAQFGLTSDGERGLLGVAAAPDYAVSGKFYVYYTDLEGDIRIDEFRRSAGDVNVADPGSRREVLEVPHRSADNHNGGTVMFGPDGCLWAATGDGGGGGDQFNQAQNLETLLGKVLRIDPDPPGDPNGVCRFSTTHTPAPDLVPPRLGSGGASASMSPIPTMGAGSADRTPPVLRARIPRLQRVLSVGAALAFARCDEPCRLSIGGRVRIGERRIELPRDTRVGEAQDRQTMRLRLTRGASRAVRRALHQGLNPYLRLGLRARDTAGNGSRLVRVTVRIRRLDQGPE